jgi:predicted ATPase
MLSRLYIDNFRCFVNFETKLAPRQLMFGGNGSGKSSLLDALLLLRQFVIRGEVLDDHYILNQRTRWQNQSKLTCELEAVLESEKYLYRLVIEPWGEGPKPRVCSETLHLEGKPIFEFLTGEVHIYNDRFEHKVTYEFDWHRSALATIISRRDNQLLTRFKSWLAGLHCFRINPFSMTSRAESELIYPTVDLSSVASWYRHLVQSDPQQNAALLNSLRECIDGFRVLRFEPAGENVRLLSAEFQTGQRTDRFYFNELSDGQRCLVCLYMILHFLIAKGATVVIDEPENFVSLREIQPWLMATQEAVEEHHGQIVLVSHHPEVINQWAPTSGLQLVRDDAGPVRARPFLEDPEDGCLPPSELLARGWDRE